MLSRAIEGALCFVVVSENPWVHSSIFLQELGAIGLLWGSVSPVSFGINIDISESQ